MSDIEMAYFAGYEARALGQLETSNPYEAGSDMRMQWLSGWCDADAELEFQEGMEDG